MTIIEKIKKRILKFKTKLVLRKRLPYGRMVVRNRFDDIRDKLNKNNPVIVDGGAHKGVIIDLFLNQYTNPTIYAFEPIPNLAKDLKSKYSNNKNVKIYDSTLGNISKEIEFNILKHEGASSPLTPSNIIRNYLGEKMDIKQSIKVKQVRLDEILSGDIDLLKLDLQGYEIAALEGSEHLLKKIKIITTEIEFIPIYQIQPLFSDIDIHPRQSNFKLFNFYELFTHKDGQLTAVDAVYLNKIYLNN